MVGETSPAQLADTVRELTEEAEDERDRLLIRRSGNQALIEECWDDVVARAEEAERDLRATEGLAADERERRIAAETRAAKLEAALNAIRGNASGWHGDDAAKEHALNVIATWAADPDSIPAALLVSAGRDEEPSS